MDYKELFIGISITSAVSFFSSVIRTDQCSAQTPLYLSDSHESVVKGKYKSPFYKLWQDATKNKPSLYNDGVVYYENIIKRIFTSYKCSLKNFLQLKNYIKQVTSIKFQRSMWLKIRIFSRDFNNICWRSVLYPIPCIDLVCWIFVYIRNILRRKHNNNHKEYSKLSSLVLQIYKIKRQQEKAPHRIGICINKILHNKVYC